MASKGKAFRSSPLCSQQAGDSVSENDEEVEQILSQSQSKSRKRSAQGEDDCIPQNERRETDVSSTEPANIVGWTPEQVKTWICSFFGESVGQKFVEEEIDGKALLSKRLEEDTTLEKLGVTTIGKKERFSRELMAIKPAVNDTSHPFGSGHKRKKIERSSFKDYDRLLTTEERQYLNCKEKSIYNTKKKKITKEVEKRWPRGSALPVYRNKADAIQVDKFVAKLVEDDTLDSQNF